MILDTMGPNSERYEFFYALFFVVASGIPMLYQTYST